MENGIKGQASISFCLEWIVNISCRDNDELHFLGLFCFRSHSFFFIKLPYFRMRVMHKRYIDSDRVFSLKERDSEFDEIKNWAESLNFISRSQSRKLLLLGNFYIVVLTRC